MEGKDVVFLSRHGPGHRLLPTEINYRANIYGFKQLGVGRIISVSAVGSLREEMKPKDLVIPDQFFDRTRRKNSFFGEGIVAHVSFADPICPQLSRILYESGKSLGLQVHPQGTYICIEGPAFSTKAESHIYRSWNCDIIGMTSVTEAKLCREAEICYATMSMVTDYDVWHESEDSVSVEVILGNLAENINNAKAVLKKVLAALPDDAAAGCDCSHAMENCIVTRAYLITEDSRKKLQYIIKKYIAD